MPPSSPSRSIRSFVVRSGRLTDAQRRALEELWPRFGVEFSHDWLDLDALYARHAPRVVEIGFGNGTYLSALASHRPERDYLGIEVHSPGVGHLLRRLAERSLTNVRVSQHDAVEVLERQIPSGSIEEFHILFPDPWPKKRHHKRRLIQPTFAACLADRLAPGGILKLATDWRPYADHILQVLDAIPELLNVAADGRFAERSTERHPTRFEQRGERLGHQIWELAYRKR